MRLTVGQIAAATGAPTPRAERFADALNEAMAKFEINTPARQAAFLAQVGHESGRLVYVREIATGQAYEGRKDLGNVKVGDGRRFKGRGLIQLTGRFNYAKCAAAFGVDCINKPELLEQMPYCAYTAAWFWSVNGLNPLADASKFEAITRRINGGLNGYADRLVLWKSAKRALQI